MWCVKRVASLSYTTRIHFKYSESIRYASNLAPSYLHYPGAEPLRHLTWAQTLQVSADRWPDRIAVRSVYQDISLTYSQLLVQADALGCGLRAVGLQRGDRLGVWAHNCAEWIVTLAAAGRVGLIPVALNPAYEEAELSFCIKKVGMKGLVIADDAQNRKYSRLLGRLIPELRNSTPGELNSKVFPDLKTVVTLSKERQSGSFVYQNLIGDYHTIAKTEASKWGSQIQSDDGCIIHFTSGTTGTPKAALVSHFSTVNNSYIMGKRITLNQGYDKICVQVPIFHAFGTVITVMSALQHGSTLVLPSPFYSPSANVNALFSERCTVIHGTPTMYVDAVNLLRNNNESAPNIRVALTAGAPCSPQLFKDMQQHLNAESVKSIYGMTETTASVFQSISGESTDKVTDTVGHLHDHLEVKVVDEDNRTVPFGSPGELLIRGYNVMMGYWGEEEKTRQTITSGGWLKTGDQFTIGEDGYGRIVGRLKDLIIRGGENIPPKEIEDVLNTHPDIIECQVFGVSDSRLGEEVCAALRMRDDKTLSADDIARYCRGKIAQYKLPRLVKTVQDFPKTASGKVQKYKLKEMVDSGKL